MKADLFVITATSGTGKTRLIQCLKRKIPELKLCISHTTRPKRKGEKDKRDYFFVSKEGFAAVDNSRTGGGFIEKAIVYGNHYGTSYEQLTQLLNKEDDILLELDWQGAKNIKRRFPTAVTIFILPPSIQQLKRRLQQRGTDSTAVIEERARVFKKEMAQHRLFDYLIVNQELDRACHQLYCIIMAHRLRHIRQTKNLKDLLDKLLVK